MTSKKNKQNDKTKQLFNANKQENYQSSFLKELKNSIAANNEKTPNDKNEKSINEEQATPAIIFKKNQYKCPYCSSSIEPKVIDNTLPIRVRCLECIKTGKKDDFLVKDKDEPSWNSVHFL